MNIVYFDWWLQTWLFRVVERASRLELDSTVSKGCLASINIEFTYHLELNEARLKGSGRARHWDNGGRVFS
jgi:hypothetical protein